MTQDRKSCKYCAKRLCHSLFNVLICVIGLFKDFLRENLLKLCSFPHDSLLDLPFNTICYGLGLLMNPYVYVSTYLEAWFCRYRALSEDIFSYVFLAFHLALDLVNIKLQYRKRP